MSLIIRSLYRSPATDSIQIYRMYQAKQSDVQTLDVGRGTDYGQMQLSWSNGPITVLACTNRTYSTNDADWFVLAGQVRFCDTTAFFNLLVENQQNGAPRRQRGTHCRAQAATRADVLLDSHQQRQNQHP